MTEPVPDCDWSRYADAVWTAFLRRSGEPEVRMMSAIEWRLMHRWLVQGVPLRVVLRGLEDCRGRGRVLQFYAPAVEDAYAHFRTALGGWS